MKRVYKDTALGVLPEDWEVVKLGEIFKRNTRKNVEDNRNALTISAQFGLISQTEFFKKTIASSNLTGYYLLYNGDFAYNKSYSAGYPMGVLKRLDRYDKGVVSTLYICFSKYDLKSDSDFYVHYFEAGYFNDQLASIAKEGARAHGLLNVGVNDFFNLLVVRPPLPEQQKIAEILSTVDEKTAVIDEQLAKTTKLKTGLMQRLLTKGIGHMEFKDSPLGEIPKEWRVELLGKVFPRIVVGYVGSISDSYCDENEGVPFIRTLNVRDGHFDAKGLQFVSKVFHQQNKKSWVVNGDILIARVGANMGMTCKVTNLSREANAANVIIIKEDDLASSDFYTCFLCSEYGQKQIQTNGVGGAQAVLNTGAAQKLLVPVPPLTEQYQIANLLTTVDDKIQVLHDKKAHYQTLKRGLMQQLLTGKLRVRVAQDAVAA